MTRHAGDPGAENLGALWTADAAAAAIGAERRGVWRDGGAIDGVEMDSRAAGPGDLFVALTTGARDAHGFIAAAIEAGAAGALATRSRLETLDGLAPGAPLLVVDDDTLPALERLATAARARLSDAHVIGVTGSAGKTTVKEMLGAMARAVLPPERVHAAAKSFNNHIGVPLTLARMARDVRLAVVEIGMNHPGEIAPLARLAQPHAAIVTTVAPAHLEAFGRVELIADEKVSIAEGLVAGGAAILNKDNPYFARMAARVGALGREIVDFGVTAEAARLIESRLTADGQTVRAEVFGRRLEFGIGGPGRHLAMNAVGALAALARAGLDVAAAAEALADWRPPGGRGARSRLAAPAGGTYLLVDESYNANPASVRAALESFASEPPEAGGRRIAFLTDMLELGDDAAALHADLADAIADARVDELHTAGPLMRALYDAVAPGRRGEHFDEPEALAARAPHLVRRGDVVVVKGSLGSRAHKVAAALRTAAET